MPETMVDMIEMKNTKSKPKAWATTIGKGKTGTDAVDGDAEVSSDLSNRNPKLQWYTDLDDIEAKETSKRIQNENFDRSDPLFALKMKQNSSYRRHLIDLQLLLGRSVNQLMETPLHIAVKEKSDDQMSAVG